MEYPPLPPDRWPDAPGRYPDPAVRVLDPRFERYRLHNAAVERIATGYRWAEGPVWFGDHRCLLWSDIPSDRMLRWDEATGTVSVFRSPANNANGHTRDRQGRLVSCEHLTRRVTRTEHDGSITVLADRFDGRPLNAPNDVVVASDGVVWFTDPGYGILSDYEGRQAALELPTAVYRLDPDRGGGPEPVIEDLERPNGLCFAPDESRLYVVDSGSAGGIHVYEVAGGGSGAGGRSRTWARAARTASAATPTATSGPPPAVAATATTACTCSPPTAPGSARSSSPRPAPTCASAARPATGCS